MTPKETVENNKLIAEFMGVKTQDKGPFCYQVYDQQWAAEGLRYHSSFNWLMDVVEKIEEGNYGFKTCRKVVEVYFDDTKEIILKTKENCRLNSLHKAVVEFVKWHNAREKSKSPLESRIPTKK